VNRLRIACFTPLPPAATGIADYSAILLPQLARRVDLTVFTDEPTAVPPDLRRQLTIKPYPDYPPCRFQFDLPLYQMGNSRHHAGMYPYALRYPGVVVLHDLTLHHFIADQTGGGPGYAREIGLATGSSDLAWEIRAGIRPSPPFDLPLVNRLQRVSLGLFTNSRYTAACLPPAPKRPLHVLPPMIELRPGHSRRDELAWPETAVIFASVGQVTAAKRIDAALRAFRRLLDEGADGRYLIVGQPMADGDLPALIQSLELGSFVHQTGYAPDLQTFVDWIETADVIINLRHPTAGETSATALRGMAARKPLIVFDQGWYSELPDDACWKAAPMDEAGLLAAMRELAANPARRQAMGAAGRRYVAGQCQPAQAAGVYAAFLVEVKERVAGSGS